MSLDLFIKAIKPAGELHNKMMQAYKACCEAQVSVPKEVEVYFGGNEPNLLGVEINHYDLPKECRDEFNNGYQSGFRIDLSKLPDGVQYLEVYLS